MDITLSENLKRIRKNKDISQQQLADYLQISFQAVSKWENGITYPDINLLPRIASYFDVSVDELLGVDKVKENEKINEYYNESNILNSIGLVNELLELWKKANIEFPNNYGIKYSLMYAYFNVNSNEYPEREEKIIELGNNILENCTDNNYRDGAIQLLTFIYASKKEFDIAEKYVNMASNLWCSSQILRSSVLKGEEKAKWEQQTFLWLIDLMYRSAYNIVYKSSIDENYEYKYKLFESMMKIYNIVFEDGNYGYYSCNVVDFLLGMAKFNILLNGVTNKTLDLLNKAKEYCIYFETYEKFKHKSLMLNLIEDGPDNKAMDTDVTLTVKMLDFLNNKEFDSIRCSNEFISIIEDLNQYPKSRKSYKKN